MVSSERQCLYDSRCDISGIDEIPCLIAITTDGMDDCRKMMPGKGQVEYSTILAKISPCQSDLWESGNRGFIYISFRYLWNDGPSEGCWLSAYSLVSSELKCVFQAQPFLVFITKIQWCAFVQLIFFSLQNLTRLFYIFSSSSLNQ